MSTAVDVSCPNCDKTLKVPPAVFGKKVKCKYCDHAFVARDPDAAAVAKPAKPTKPGAKPEAKAAAKPAASPPPPPPPPAPAKKNYDDDEGPENVTVIKEDDNPRCPHCAKELDPPDAIICLSCGFNNRTREKAETKKVWAPTAEDWAKHLAPGVIALVICITLLVVNVISFLEMREWLEGSFLEKDEKDAAGRKTFYIHPAAFKFLILGPSIAVFVPAVKFAYRRLVQNFKPDEKAKK